MLDFIGRILTIRFFDKPILVIGLGRSGTTALTNSIGKLPEVKLFPIEATLFHKVGRLAYGFEYGEKADYYSHNLRVPKEYLYQSFRRLCFATCAGKHYGLRPILKQFSKLDFTIFRKKYWVTKAFPTYEDYLGLKAIYPDAKFVHVIREGCKVVHSMTRSPAYKGKDFRYYCELYKKYVDQYEYVVNSADAIRVRHEELVDNPEKDFQRICKLIGCEYHDNSARFLRRTLVHPLDKPSQESVCVQAELAKRKHPWEVWSDKEKRIFLEVCSDAMKKAGYDVPTG